MSFLRRRPVPPAVKAVALAPGERRLAWAVTPAAEPVVATEEALLLPGGARLEWHRIEKATWQRPHLHVLEVQPVGGTGAQHRLELADEGGLPEVVRDRVTSSVAWATTARIDPDGGVRIVGRRVPDAEDLEWQLVFDQGTDPDDPLVRAQAEHALKGARRTIG